CIPLGHQLRRDRFAIALIHLATVSFDINTRHDARDGRVIVGHQIEKREVRLMTERGRSLVLSAWMATAHAIIQRLLPRRTAPRGGPLALRLFAKFQLARQRKKISWNKLEYVGISWKSRSHQPDRERSPLAALRQTAKHVI